MDVLFFADKQVRERLFARVGAADRPLLIVGTRQEPGMAPVAKRQPFLTLEERFRHVMELVVVVDEGKVQGMWRDPLGNLADSLFPYEREKAYEAANGWLLLVPGSVPRMARKRVRWEEDVLEVHRLLADAMLVAPPKPGARAGGTSAAASAPRKSPPSHRPAQAQKAPAPRKARPATPDPWKVLGLEPGVSRDEARRIFHALISQYHPDKVAHLAPEFQALAERKSRDILWAWETLEKQLS